MVSCHTRSNLQLSRNNIISTHTNNTFLLLQVHVQIILFIITGTHRNNIIIIIISNYTNNTHN